MPIIFLYLHRNSAQNIFKQRIMQENLFKCDEVQLRILLYALVTLKSHLACPDVLLNSVNASRFNHLLENIIECSPLSFDEKKFYYKFMFDLNEKH